MLENLKKKPYLPYILAVLAVIIWGHNGYQVFRGLLKSDDISGHYNVNEWQPQKIAVNANLNGELFIYKAQYRDPFKNWLRDGIKKRPKRMILKKAKQKKPLPSPPVLRLTGVLKDEYGVLAIIEAPGGDVQFVRESGEIAGVTIVSIDSNSVNCKFGKQAFRLRLRP